MRELILPNTNLPSVTEAVKKGIEIASGAKSSATYYHSSGKQIEAIRGSINTLYAVGKELPLLLANLPGASGRFIQEVLVNEFKNTANGGACKIVHPTDWFDLDLGDKALLNALNTLNKSHGITYVLRTFAALKDNRINNERSKKIANGFIWSNSNLEFYAVKYRNKLNSILRHTLGAKKTSILVSIAQNYLRSGLYVSDKERNLAYKYILRYSGMDDKKALATFLFIMSKGEEGYYPANEYPILSQYFVAKRDILNVTRIPKEVLVGLVSDRTHPQYTELWSTENKREATKAKISEKDTVTSINQQVRETKRNQKLGVSKAVNLDAVSDFLALYKTGYETGFTAELENAIDALATKKKYTNFPYRNIGIVLDTSDSMRGNSVESKNTPKAIGDFTKRILSQSVNDFVSVETSGFTTDLARSFIELMQREDAESKYEAVFVITDGYENSYDGLFSEVVDAFRDRSDRSLPIYQISPITGAEMKGKVRSIGSGVATLAVTKPEGLVTQMTANLLDADIRQWLLNEFSVLEESNLRRVSRESLLTQN